MLLARRIYPDAPNHQLGTLARVLRLPDSGRAHRALADAETTAHLLVRLRQELMNRFGLAEVSPELLLAIQSKSRSQLENCVSKHQQADKSMHS